MLIMARTIKTPRLEFSVSTEHTPCDKILKSVKKGDAKLDLVFLVPENEEYPLGYSGSMRYFKGDLIDSLPLHAEKISDDEVKIVEEPQTIKFSIQKQFKDYFLSPDARFELRGLDTSDKKGWSEDPDREWWRVVYISVIKKPIIDLDN